MIKKLAKRKNYLLILFAFILVYFITYIHPTFLLDESFTFALVKKSFSGLIKLDSMDVHPPLYYILLKVFLLFTTFWTHSIFIKVVFARLFSILAFLLFFYIGEKIWHKCSIGLSFRLYLSILFLIPAILVNIIKIRMYSLSTLFLIIEFYNLMKFDKNNKTRYLIYATIFAICNVYTFYFAGLSAGIFIALFAIRKIYNKKIYSALRLCFSGICLIISFMPWIPIVLFQFKYHMHADNGEANNYVISSISAISQMGTHNSVIITLIGLIVCIYYFIFIGLSYKDMNNHITNLLTIVLLDALITLIISLIVCKRNFQGMVIYPVFSICILLILPEFVHIIQHMNINNYSKLLGLSFMVIILSLSLIHIGDNIYKYDIPSVKLVQNFTMWKSSHSNNIQLQSMEYPINKSMTISEDSIYLSSIHKNLLVKKSDYKDLSPVLVNDNRTKLVKHLFNNVKINKENSCDMKG